jgi:hypothetical protein
VNIFGVANGDQLFQRVKLGNDYTGWSQIPGTIHNTTATKEGGGQAVLVLIGLDLNGNHRAQEREGFRRCGATISAGSGRALINYVEIARIQGQICNDSGLPTALLIDSFSRLL